MTPYTPAAWGGIFLVTNDVGVGLFCSKIKPIYCFPWGMTRVMHAIEIASKKCWGISLTWNWFLIS